MTIETLSFIWRRVLGVSSVKAEDNFFDLGGDRLLADELFAEIKQECGRDLAAELICVAPTLASFAELLAQPAALKVPQLLLLKSGTEQPPIFLMHGISGSVLEVVPIARRIQSQRPIYALQARGVDGLEQPFGSLEEFTRSYVKAIQSVQPTGPYSLIGYSFGGLVALEMATTLRESGKDVSLLAMLDSYPANRHLRFRPRVSRFTRRVREHAFTILNRGLAQGLDKLGVLQSEEATAPASKLLSWTSKYAQLELDTNSGSDKRVVAPSRPVQYSSAAREGIRLSSYNAWYHYRPRRYDGTVHFIQAAVKWVFPADPVSVWGHLVRDLKVARIGCNHLQMTTSHAGAVASKLSECLAAEEVYVEQRVFRVRSGT